MKEKKAKRIILLIITQIIILALYAAGNFFALKIETVVLTPLLYLAPFGALLLLADIICMALIFKKKKNIPAKSPVVAGAPSVAPIPTPLNYAEPTTTPVQPTPEPVVAPFGSNDAPQQISPNQNQGANYVPQQNVQQPRQSNSYSPMQAPRSVSTSQQNPSQVLYSSNMAPTPAQQVSAIANPQVIFSKNMQAAQNANAAQVQEQQPDTNEVNQ